VQAIFQAPIFQAWLTGTHELHLFLDSLDECLLRIDTVANLLVDEFSKYPVARLNLRIACRTAEWPSGLERGLKQIWGENEIKVYELAPLRRIDVITAAKDSDLQTDAFLSELDKKEVVPLAIKPITLRFLLNTYLEAGQFPSRQADLYREGCRILCEESSESRRDAGRLGTLSAEQRLSVAARIAAVTIFSNRYAIWTSIDTGDVPSEDLKLPELCGTHDGSNVTEKEIREVLGTGLFSSRGPHRMGWAHQTYTEFLPRYI
jgi:predicted NACHT family NTPase